MKKYYNNLLCYICKSFQNLYLLNIKTYVRLTIEILIFYSVIISCETNDYSAPTVKYATYMRFCNLSIFLTIDFQTGIMAEGSTFHL